MLSRFFINRPIFAAVLSIVITLAGGLSVFTLPLAQFPSISPPTVQVTCNYPGANAKDVAEAVAAPIEQQVNGVEGMMYMSSQCTNDGTYNLTVTFKHGVDLDMAQVLVQNRVNLAVPSLPEVIKQTGVTTLKRSPDILMGYAVNSPNGRYDQLYLSNYALMQIRDELSRVPGVADVFLFGQRDYSMRIWVDPERLAVRGMTAADVVNAIRDQNAQVATGSIGQPPTDNGQAQQIPLSTLGRLVEVGQFENIVVKTARDGRLTRIKDVARVKLGAKNQDVTVRFDDKPTTFLAVFQMPDANALETHDRVVAKMNELAQNFPEGVVAEIAFDTTPYTRESISEVFKTLTDAVILVAIVVLLFLQNWRSAIIPLIAVPVAIIGSFAAMAPIGFSLNNLTLFGLVLAIGIVVDDAIVVVEAVEHHIEHGLPPRAATIKAMEQVSGPVVAVGLVLSAVFIPCAFIGGITGAFFRQFAMTIAVSTVISAFNSLTLSPALTALLLRPLPAEDKETRRQGDKETRKPEPLPRWAYPLLGGWLGWKAAPVLTAWVAAHGFQPPILLVSLSPCLLVSLSAIVGWVVGGPMNRMLGWFFRLFNQGFRWATHGYTRVVGKMLRVSVAVLIVYAGLLALTLFAFLKTPKGFIPSGDMGYLMVNVQLPDSASTERTYEVMQQVAQIARSTPGVKHATAITGQSFVLNAIGSNFGSMFINLNDYGDRRDPGLSSDAIAARLRQRFAAEVYDAAVAVFGPPPVRGAGRAGGFALMVEDRGDLGPKELQAQTENLVHAGSHTPGLLGMFSVFRANVPQLHIDPDPRECMTRGVSLQDFADTLTIYQGSLYVNDFNRFGRTWQVIVQAEPRFRNRPEELTRLAVRNRQGKMVPLGSLATIHEVNGPLVLSRYNMYPAASINGAAAPGVSSGQAITILQQLAERELGHAMAYEWTDMSYLELLAGNTATIIFGFSVLMVFLVLAALYESWSLPLAVILVVPMCLLCSLAGVIISHMDVNIFTRIGFVVLVGLASKNAVLIVEFAKLRREAGTSRRDATLAACQLRLRPIIMTSFAFILGVVPLILSKGAGAEMRQTLGTAVFYGMLGVTLFGIFLTPVFFYVINWLSETSLFTAGLLPRLGRIGLDVLTLGLWRGLRLLRGRWRRPLRPALVPGRNGHLTPPLSANGNQQTEAAVPGESVSRK